MIYNYVKLSCALVLGLLAIGQLSLAVRAYELRVQNEVLLTRVQLGLLRQSGGHPAGTGAADDSLRAVLRNPATVVALHQAGVEL